MTAKYRYHRIGVLKKIDKNWYFTGSKEYGYYIETRKTSFYVITDHLLHKKFVKNTTTKLISGDKHGLNFSKKLFLVKFEWFIFK